MIDNFFQAHNHNGFSLLDGLGSPEQYAVKAKELGFKYLGITNHGSTDGLISFQKACEDNGVIPISGIEFYIVPNGMTKVKGEKRGHLTAWIKNETGYHNVLRMLTIANLDMFYYRPRVDYETFLSHCEGLCVGTACSASFLHNEGGIEFFENLHKKIKDDLYLEIMPHSYDEQIKTNQICLDLYEKYDVKLLATNDCHYINADDAESHEVLLACQTKKKWNDPNRWKFNVDGLYLCEPESMIERFNKQGQFHHNIIDEAMSNTIDLAEKCKDFRITKQEIILPIPPQYEGMDEKQVIRKLCHDGIKGKIDNFDQVYKDRLKYELSVIEDFGVVRYFLVVADVIKWCEENNILTGPGRGSAAGCLVSYLLGITKVDPIVFGLFFERFLNPGRRGIPDIDCDIEDVRRADVIEHLKTLYGEFNISGITTFLKIEHKAALKDVARVFDANLQETNIFSKSIQDDIETALETTEGKIYKDKYPEVIKHALALRGQIKAKGRHAAASIISPIDLTLGTRSYLSERSGQLVVGLDGYDSEHQGLVKVDFLGLSTLSVIHSSIDLIKKNHGIKIGLQKIPLDDALIYKEISAGNNVGCFQISTHTLTNLIKLIEVESLFHLSDAVAAVRPGAYDSGATAKYIERKHGLEWEPKHPIYEEITKNTYGIILYQEQVINVIHKIAGLSLATADEIRRIIGKKRDVKFFAKYKDEFVNGCIKQGTFSEQEANDFWDELGYHSNYSFSLGHSIPYSIISYWTAWLKYYYSAEFICASLTYGSEGQKHALVREAQRIGLSIIPPRIGVSHTKNWVVKENRLYVPFLEVQGIGPKMIGTIQEYMDSCKSGFFSDTDKPIIKGKLKTILDDIGAFDNTLTENIDNYFDLGIAFNPKKMYPKLYKLLGQNEKTNINDLLCGNIKNRNLVKLVKKKSIKELTQCNLCDIRKEAKAPVPMTFGMYNILILDEYPGWMEDKHGKAMISDASEKMLFPMLKEYGYEKDDFCLSSLVKCKCKNPEINVVKNCSRWLRREIERCEAFMVLAFGNTGIKMFKGEESGIQKINATCEWNEEFGVWVCYSVSPVSALFHIDAKSLFENGIRNFTNKLECLGGFE